MRLFNLYNWIDDESIPAKIQDFIRRWSPLTSSVCFQEFDSSARIWSLRPIAYKHQTNASNSGSKKSELAILSTYKILNSGSLLSFLALLTARFSLMSSLNLIPCACTMYTFNRSGIDANVDVESLDSEQSNKLLESFRDYF